MTKQSDTLSTLRSELLDESRPTYLGDGVEATFDGYLIWVTAGNNRIALEPEGMATLKRYADRIDVLRRAILAEMDIT